jgi:hypothetical protein
MLDSKSRSFYVALRCIVLGLCASLGYCFAPWLFLLWAWALPSIRDSLMLPIHFAGSRWIVMFSAVFVWLTLERGLRSGFWQLSFWHWFIRFGVGFFLMIQVGYTLSIATDLQLWVVDEYSLEANWHFDKGDFLQMPLKVLLWWIVNIDYRGGLNFDIERIPLSEFRLFMLPILIWLLGTGWGCRFIGHHMANLLLRFKEDDGKGRKETPAFLRRLGIDLAAYQWFILYLNCAQFSLWPPSHPSIYIAYALWGLFSIICCAALTFVILYFATRLLYQ